MLTIEDRDIQERLTTTATTRKMKTSRDRKYGMNFMTTAITGLMQQTVMGISRKPWSAVKEGEIGEGERTHDPESRECKGPKRRPKRRLRSTKQPLEYRSTTANNGKTLSRRSLLTLSASSNEKTTLTRSKSKSRSGPGQQGRQTTLFHPHQCP